MKVQKIKEVYKITREDETIFLTVDLMRNEIEPYRQRVLAKSNLQEEAIEYVLKLLNKC